MVKCFSPWSEGCGDSTNPGWDQGAVRGRSMALPKRKPDVACLGEAGNEGGAAGGSRASMPWYRYRSPTKRKVERGREDGAIF